MIFGKSLLIATNAFFFAGISWAAFTNSKARESENLTELIAFTDASFNKNLADVWKTKFSKTQSQGNWHLYKGKFGAIYPVMFGVCNDRVVHLYASLKSIAPKIGKPENLKELIYDSFSEPVLDHLVIIEDSEDDKFVLFRSKLGAAQCGK